MTLDQLHNNSVPQFAHPYNENNNTNHYWLIMIKCVDIFEALRKVSSTENIWFVI